MELWVQSTWTHVSRTQTMQVFYNPDYFNAAATLWHKHMRARNVVKFSFKGKKESFLLCKRTRKCRDSSFKKMFNNKLCFIVIIKLFLETEVVPTAKIFWHYQNLFFHGFQGLKGFGLVQVVSKKLTTDDCHLLDTSQDRIRQETTAWSFPNSGYW